MGPPAGSRAGPTESYRASDSIGSLRLPPGNTETVAGKQVLACRPPHADDDMPRHALCRMPTGGRLPPSPAPARKADRRRPPRRGCASPSSACLGRPRAGQREVWSGRPCALLSHSASNDCGREHFGWIGTEPRPSQRTASALDTGRPAAPRISAACEWLGLARRRRECARARPAASVPVMPAVAFSPALAAGLARLSRRRALPPCCTRPTAQVPRVSAACSSRHHRPHDARLGGHPPTTPSPCLIWVPGLTSQAEGGLRAQPLADAWRPPVGSSIWCGRWSTRCGVVGAVSRASAPPVFLSHPDHPAARGGRFGARGNCPAGRDRPAATAAAPLTPQQRPFGL